MKKTPLQIANAIKENKILLQKIISSDNNISKMILITDFIIDFDSYYIDFDKDLHPNLWETTYNMLIN